MEAHQKALNKAKIALMSKADSSFFTTLCFGLKHVWDDSIPTAATNGTTVYYNPEFFMELSEPERVFLLVHETMHVALLHMERLKDRNHQRWNVAADHVINLSLIARGFTMPSMGLADKQYTDMSTDEVYKLLPESIKPPPMDDLLPPDMDDDALREQVQDMVVRAAIQSQIDEDKAGTIPGDIQVFLNKLLKPKLPWYRILSKYIRALSKDDYSYQKPNRRFLPKFYLPGLKSEKLMEIAVAIDTSGSVSQQDFDRIVSEIYGIFRMMKPNKMTVLHFDTTIKSVDQVRNIQDLKNIKFTGDGGTNVAPVAQWAIENKPQLLLIFTDGYFRPVQEVPKLPVIWLIHQNPGFEPPFGKAIHYEI